MRLFQFRVFRVIRVPGIKTRITHNNFGYRNLLPDLVFGFFEFGFSGSSLGFSSTGFGFRVICPAIAGRSCASFGQTNTEEVLTHSLHWSLGKFGEKSDLVITKLSLPRHLGGLSC